MNPVIRRTGGAARRLVRRLRNAARAFRAIPPAAPTRIKVGGSRPPTGFPPLTESQQAVVDDFHKLYYEQRVEERKTVILFWLGWPMFKSPADLWTYQEIVTATRPEVIIECGTRYGGGALFLASLFDLIGGPGEVITIDIDTQPGRPVHPRIRYVSGSTVDPDIFAEIRRASEGRRTMVILDSDHSAAHVRRELAIYPDLVSVGSYLIVDDTDIGGNPVWQDDDPGPMAALLDWLPTTDSFVSDRDRERFMLTLNPRGFLKRVR